MKHMAHIYAFNIWLTFLSAESNLCPPRRDVRDYQVSSHIYDSKCFCDSHQLICARKCCDKNYFLNIFSGTCVYNNSVKFEVPALNYRNNLSGEQFNVSFIHGWMKCANDYSGGYFHLIASKFYVKEDGRLWISGFDKYVDHDYYCLDYHYDTKLAAYVCISVNETDDFLLSHKLTYIGKLISLPFLLATFVIYAVLPLRNLHAKSVMCFVFALFWAYLSYSFYFAFLKRIRRLTIVGSKAIQLLYLYFFLASFFWMNVMCIDIWKTFNGTNSFPNTTHLSIRRRFVGYSLYAWGSPLVIMVIIWSIYNTAPVNMWYQAQIDGNHWLNDGAPLLLYFCIPKAVLIVANMVLFGATTWKMKKLGGDTALLGENESWRTKNANDQQRFKNYLKLFLIMGFNWSVEATAWLVDWQVKNAPRALWCLTNICNAAFGLVVFFMFAFKRNAWVLLKTKFAERGRNSQKPIDAGVPSTSVDNCLTYL